MNKVKKRVVAKLYGYQAGNRWVVTMQSNATWWSRIGDFFAWLEYKLDEVTK